MDREKFVARYQVVETFVDRTLDRLALGPLTAVIVAVVLLAAICFGIWLAR